MAAQQPVPKLDVRCEACGASMLVRKNRETGHEFMGCSQWPECNQTQAMPAYVAMLRAGAQQMPGFER